MSPQFVAPSLNPKHASNALDQMISAVTRAMKLDLATTEPYPNTSNNEKLESVSSLDAAKLKSIVDEFPSSKPELSIDPDTIQSLVDQLLIDPNKSKMTKQETVKILIDVLSKDDNSAT